MHITGPLITPEHHLTHFIPFSNRLGARPSTLCNRIAEKTPSRAEQVVRSPPRHTAADPKVILTFHKAAPSCCGGATNNFTASCVAAASHLLGCTLSLFRERPLTWRGRAATSQVREAPRDARGRKRGRKKKASRLSSVCPPAGMIKAPLRMLFLSSGCFDRTIPQLAGSLRADGR